MENEAQQQNAGTDKTMSYVIGGVVLLAIVGGAYFFRQKPAPANPAPQTITVVATPTPTLGPITGLACDTQYYNPVIGFNKYYLSVEGGDVSTAKTVDCVFAARIGDNVIATASISSPLTNQPQRGGSTFRCTTEALPMEPNMPTTVDVVLTDDLKASSSCSATFVFTPQI
ncbi:hypothetical protein KKB64_02385 [Patescibacteria group bacterium]|nr:hypothetical protein [Patescibacteria group bacterium]MBU1472615.1 hypothetical protein [Patescibacteria group bacterium]MBU2544073.1 hypothetical protein [Patescibacteria group bacterium]